MSRLSLLTTDKITRYFSRALNLLWARFKLDIPLMIGIILLCLLGLIVLYSASAFNLKILANQALRLGLGLVLLLLVAQITPITLRNWTPWMYLISMLVLLLIPILGSGRSARSWLDLGFFYVQPAELLKLTLPMMVSWYFHDRVLPPTWASLIGAFVIIGLPVGLIVVQPDLGTGTLVAASGAFVIFLAGLSRIRIALLLGIVAALVPLAWNVLHEYQRDRLRMFLNPEADPLGAGWNIIQAEIAVGSGGWWGKGFGMSTQAKLDFLPEHTTDFIFAVFAEEFGLVGVLLVITLYLFIIGRGLWIAANARDTYSRLLAGSLSLTFFVYVIVNGGMITGLLPVVGVPMPLISYGGTSAVSLLTGFGILQSIHSYRRS